jgi:hypothetical protein
MELYPTSKPISSMTKRVCLAPSLVPGAFSTDLNVKCDVILMNTLAEDSQKLDEDQCEHRKKVEGQEDQGNLYCSSCFNARHDFYC